MTSLNYAHRFGTLIGTLNVYVELMEDLLFRLREAKTDEAREELIDQLEVELGRVQHVVERVSEKGEVSA